MSTKKALVGLFILMLLVALTTLVLAGDDDYITGGTVDFSSFGYFEYGTVINLADIPVYPEPGYRFVGWQDADGTFITEVVLTADTEVYPIFELITYTLTVVVSGSGSVDDILPGTYASSEAVELDDSFATAGSGHIFSGYQDEAEEWVSVISMDDDRTITAAFIPDSCAISFLSNEYGVINDLLFQRYDYGSEIDLSAISVTPDEGHVLSHWEDQGGQSFDISYTVQGDQTLTAIFVPISYTLTVFISGNGSINPGLAGDYIQGSSVLLFSDFIVPESGYSFTGFIDEDGEQVAEVQMNSSRTITAVFTGIEEEYALSIYLVCEITTHPYDLQWHPKGTIVGLTSLVIDLGTEYSLIGWLDDDYNDIESVLLDENKTVYGLIEKIITITPPPPPPVKQYTITLSVEPEAGGTVSGGGTFMRWTRVTVKAEANPGYEFANWTEGDREVSNNSFYTFTLSKDRDLVANFTEYTATDADLSSLEIYPGTLDPVFTPGITSYSVVVGHDTSKIEVTATLSDENASISINGSPAVSGEPVLVDLGEPGISTEIEVFVTSEDGQIEKIYTVNVIRTTSYVKEVNLIGDPENWQITEDDITFIAEVTKGNQNAEFSFWYRIPGRDWVNAKEYSKDNTWTVSTSYIGRVQVGVQAKAKGSDAFEEARDMLDYEIFKVAPVEVVELSADPEESQQAGESIIFKADVIEGNTNAEFAFYYKLEGRTWTLGRSYKEDNTWEPQTSYVGKAKVGVIAKAVGSDAFEEARAVIDYKID